MAQHVQLCCSDCSRYRPPLRPAARLQTPVKHAASATALLFVYCCADGCRQSEQDPLQPGGAQQTAGGGLLFAWAERRIALYLRTLRSLLPQVPSCLKCLISDEANPAQLVAAGAVQTSFQKAHSCAF